MSERHGIRVTLLSRALAITPVHPAAPDPPVIADTGPTHHRIFPRLEARYADALPLLFLIKDRNTPQVLNLIGYSTRKLGDIDKGIDYYRQALAVDPDYT